jgi:predicted dienelactone hydrolase
MSHTATRKILPSLHHDYIRRHRTIRRVTNVVLVTILSIAAAYLITLQPRKPFPARKASPPATSPSASPAMTPPAPPLPRLPSIDTSAGYDTPPGPYTVAEVPDIVLHDAKRNKDLHVRIFYPQDSGKFPVIVFSHGAGGSQTCCDALTRHWASYGYVTFQPTHDDSFQQRRAAGNQDVRFMEAVRDALKRPALWESRTADVSFLLDSLHDVEKRVPPVAGKLDLERIGVGGHSMGSYTSEAIGGAAVDLPGRPAASLADPRAKAILCLSPQGPGQFGLSEHSFDHLSLPYLGITGTLDNLGPIASPAWHKIPFDRSQAGDKYEVLIQGANHSSFVTARKALLGQAAQAQSMLDYTNSAALAFWDAYLKNDPAAKRYLQSNALEASSHGVAKIDRH